MGTRPQRKGILRMAPRAFQPQPHHFPPRFSLTNSKTLWILQAIYVCPGGSPNTVFGFRFSVFGKTIKIITVYGYNWWRLEENLV
jgi:hypothetical protein